jgi:hypothetical protein
MRFALVAVIALACRTGTPTAPTPPPQTPYLSLFHSGHTFSLTGRMTSRGWPAGAVTAVRCRVAESKQVSDANVARLECDAPHAGLLVVGTWVATPAGLYHPALPVDDPDELSLLGDDDLLITSTPKERDHEHALDAASEHLEALPHGGSWCVRQTTTAGRDRRSYTLCFDRTTITGIADLTAIGDDWQRVELGAMPATEEGETEVETETE